MRDNRRFRAGFEPTGDSLKTAPRGHSKDHPLIADLKRKGFIAVMHLTEQDVLDNGFIDDVASILASSRPLMRFLCEAVSLPL